MVIVRRPILARITRFWIEFVKFWSTSISGVPSRRSEQPETKREKEKERERERERKRERERERVERSKRQREREILLQIGGQGTENEQDRGRSAAFEWHGEATRWNFRNCAWHFHVHRYIPVPPRHTNPLLSLPVSAPSLQLSIFTRGGVDNACLPSSRSFLAKRSKHPGIYRRRY